MLISKIKYIGLMPMTTMALVLLLGGCASQPSSTAQKITQPSSVTATQQLEPSYLDFLDTGVEIDTYH
ncbi:hypothetical protein [Celerinatantimonas yamalensis]|uniref:Uncharacterized protein n=1 Tax=Celerinatantimonas yamalensis TaxID=559956 RepID=A0ABW9G992_9GAMM